MSQNYDDLEGKFGWMVVLTISHTPEKELGQKAPRLESYCSFLISRDLLRMLQSQNWGTKWPHIGPKNGGWVKLVYRAIEHSNIFLKM